MPAKSTAAYRFGDLLALARQSWLHQMSQRMAARGYPDYRRSDAAATRLLWHGPVPVGRLGAALGVTRQAARKVADGLHQRGFATIQRDSADARQLNVGLSPAGLAFTEAVVAVLEELNREIARRADPAQLTAADAVLRLVMLDDSTRQRADHIPAPPAP